MKELEVFNNQVNKEALALYVRAYMSNQRQGTVRTKTRGDVSGGGKKPWRQKGTGRARQGSTRAPHWVHGGVAHGPKMRDWSIKLPPAVKTEAFSSAISLKVKEGKVTILDLPELKKINTKDFHNSLKDKLEKGNNLLILPEHSEKVYKAGRNLRGLSIKDSLSVNAFDILNAKNILLVKESIEKLKGRV